MYKDVSYKKYNQLAKKYFIDVNSRENTIKEKFLKACMELPKYDLMNSHIIDNFFENGERVANIAKNILIEKAKTDFYFETILKTYFRFQEV